MSRFFTSHGKFRSCCIVVLAFLLAVPAGTYAANGETPPGGGSWGIAGDPEFPQTPPSPTPPGGGSWGAVGDTEFPPAGQPPTTPPPAIPSPPGAPRVTQPRAPAPPIRQLPAATPAQIPEPPSSTAPPAPPATPAPPAERPSPPSPPRVPQDPERPGGGGGSDWIIPVAVVGTMALGILGKLLYDELRKPPRPSPSGDSRTEADLVDRFKRYGPQFAPIYNMSAFAVRGLVRGGWPLLIDFEQSSPGQVMLKISARGIPDVIEYPLKGRAAGRHRVVLPSLPYELGMQPRPALISVTAVDLTGRNTLARFQVFGLGAGPRAIGSVAIDQIYFYPPTIRLRMGERANYQFFSHSDFDNLSVEVMKLNYRHDGSQHTCIREEPIVGGVRKDKWIGRPPQVRAWNGKDRQQKTSAGTHKLQIRAWDYEGDWLTTWSGDSLVSVLN